MPSGRTGTADEGTPVSDQRLATDEGEIIPGRASETEPDVGLSDRGTRPAPGERSMTREQWKAQDSRQRAERAVGCADQPLENPHPNAAQEGHGHGRHGYQTTDA